jgi:hypothetical protein
MAYELESMGDPPIDARYAVELPHRLAASLRPCLIEVEAEAPLPLEAFPKGAAARP